MPFTRQHFDEEIQELRSKLLEMGFATEEMVRDAVVALTTQNMELAATIIPRDDVVDDLEREIEARCLLLFAKQQPIASDLRVISTILKVITDIERIGDHAVDISRIAQRMSQGVLYKSLVDIPRLGELSQAMIHKALEAFVRQDLALVQQAIRDDDAVDSLYARIRSDLHQVMQQDPDSVLQASFLLFVAHYLERICDHCTNIVERVSFMETGHTMHETSDGETFETRRSVGVA